MPTLTLQPLADPHPTLNYLFRDYEVTVTRKENVSTFFCRTEDVYVQVLKIVNRQANDMFFLCMRTQESLPWTKKCLEIMEHQEDAYHGHLRDLVNLLLWNAEKTFDISFSWKPTVKAPSEQEKFADYLKGFVSQQEEELKKWQLADERRAASSFKNEK